MLPEQEASLTSGGNCTLHHHDEDRRVTHDQLRLMQSLEVVKFVSSDYSVLPADDIIYASGGTVLQLPLARNGRHLTVVKTGGGNVTLNCSRSDTINGFASAIISSNYSPRRLKAITDLGWMEI